MKQMSIKQFFVLAILIMAGHAWAAEDWLDVTEQYIVNPNFDNNDVRTGWLGTAFGMANPQENAEHYNKTYDTYQVITGLTPGHYRLSLSAFYRMGDANNDYWLFTSGDYSESQHAQLYASTTDAEVVTPIIPSSSAALKESLGGSASQVGNWWMGATLYIPNNMEAAFYWFEAGYYHNELEIDVHEDGILRIGVRKGLTINNDWTCLDNWRLEMWGQAVKATSVSISPSSATLVLSERRELKADVKPQNATNRTVEWSSSDNNVVTVDRTGVVTALKVGQARITATTTDGTQLQASCNITVKTNTTGLSNLMVTEIQSANLDQHVDPSWNYGGWVELYNPDNLGVSLTGCWLSDDAQNLQKVHISQPVTVPAMGHHVLWFDHHDKYCLTQMDMKLNTEGGTLYLSDEQGKLILSQEYPAAVSRCSYARKSLAGTEWGWSSTPTPGIENTGMTYADVRLPAPMVDQPTQIFDAQLKVCVNIPEGATLRYTTNGSTPTTTNGETSETGLFDIDQTTTLRFCLVGENYLPSQVVTRTYILRDKEFDLPIMSVVGNNYDLYGDDMGIFTKGNGNGRPGNGQSSPCNWNMDWDRTVNFEYLTLEGQMAINQETKIERCGGWSRAWHPYSFKLKAHKLLEGQSFLPYQFFEEKPYLKHKTLQIRNGGNDNTCRIKDPALQEIVMRSGIDIDCQGYQPVMHYINGRYAGVINIREPNNKHYVYANYGLDEDEIDQFEMSPDSGYIQKCGTYESMQRWRDLAEQCGESEEAYEEIRKMVDIDEYCNYMAVQFYLGNWDWPQNNVKGFKPIMDGGRFRFVLFDMDGAFNSSDVFNDFAKKQNYTFDRLYGEPIQHISKEIEFVTIFLNMLKNETFCKQFVDTYCLVAGSVFEPTRCKNIINELANRVSKSQNIWNEVFATRSTPWDTANQLINTLSSSRQSSMVSTLKNYAVFGLKTLTTQRVELSANIPEARLWVNDLPVPTNQFKGRLFAPVTFRTQAPVGYKFIGWKYLNGSSQTTVTLVAPNSTWQYYDQGSLDGQNWTSLNYDATTWKSGQSPLGYFVGGSRETNTYLDYGGNNNQKYPTYYFRSAFDLSQAPQADDVFTLDYTIDDGMVVYVNGTEAGRYNMPEGATTFSTYATSYAHNNPDTGSMTLDASLFRQGRNIVAVEVHNNAANSTDIYWEANLAMSSNTTTGEYVSTDETYEMPTGNLVLQACYAPMTDEEKRQAGIATTPIVINEVSAGNSININEYFKKDDWVELYNTTDEDIDLEGMYLTDRSEKPEKYQITAKGTRASTIIPAHGYKIIWCSKRETDTELHANFKLDNADSSVVRLMAADRSWADSIVYCAHNGDQTVGRYPDGGLDIYLMTQPTIRKANLLNSYAKEVQYTQPDGDGIRPTMASRNGSMSIAYSNNYLFVKSEDNPNVTVAIFTLSGELVMLQPLNLGTGNERISTFMLPNGVFVAHAKDSEGNQCVTKFVKK